MRRYKPREHKDSVRVEGVRKVTFSRGQNGLGARVNGKKQVLKKKKQEW